MKKKKLYEIVITCISDIVKYWFTIKPMDAVRYFL